MTKVIKFTIRLPNGSYNKDKKEAALKVTFFNLHISNKITSILESSEGNNHPESKRNSCGLKKNAYFCTRVSPTRHAPSEFPQGLTAARVLGCSGAM